MKVNTAKVTFKVTIYHR